MIRAIALAAVIATMPRVVVAQQYIPTCADFLAAARSGLTGAYTNYAAQVYMRLDEQRVTTGKPPIGLPPYGWSPSIDFWTRLCTGNPTQHFYNVVLSTYRLGAAMAN